MIRRITNALLLTIAALVACSRPAKQISIQTSAPPRNTAASVPAANDKPSSNPSDGAAEVDATTAGEHEAVSTPAVVSSTEHSSGESETGAADSYPKSFATSALEINNSLGVMRRLDPALCSEAQKYADLLARTHQEGHYADGTPWSRAARAGFTGSVLFNERLGDWYLDGGKWKRVIEHDAGEVLAFRHPSIEAAFDHWFNKSPGHRAVLREPSFDVCGFAKAKDANIYVGLLGNSKVAAAAPPGQVSQPVRSAPQVFSSCGSGGCGQQPQRRFRFFRGR